MYIIDEEEVKFIRYSLNRNTGKLGYYEPDKL